MRSRENKNVRIKGYEGTSRISGKKDSRLWESIRTCSVGDPIAVGVIICASNLDHIVEWPLPIKHHFRAWGAINAMFEGVSLGFDISFQLNSYNLGSEFKSSNMKDLQRNIFLRIYLALRKPPPHSSQKPRWCYVKGPSLCLSNCITTPGKFAFSHPIWQLGQVFDIFGC